MRFLVPPCALVLAALLVADARSQPGPQVKDGKLTLKLSASPAAPPVPALRWTLLPTTRDMIPGNQVQGFYKCFGEQHNFYHNKEAVEQREKWLNAPLADLRTVKELEKYGGSSVRLATRAARMEAIDWQIIAELKQDGIYTLLPDIQQFRDLARVLRVRARGEIARGDFAAAAETIQTHLALARTLNEHPTIIGSLVGIAIAATALSSVEEFVAQPGAANLFWALADLPTPLFDLRKATHGERTFLAVELDPVLDRKNPMTEAQVGVAVLKVTRLLDLVAPFKEGLAPPFKEGDPPPPLPKAQPRPKEPPTPATYLGGRAADAKQVAEARARLLPAPPVQDLRVKAFPPMQVILIDEVNRFEASRDDILKWLTVPAWQLPAGFDKAQPTGVFGPLGPGIGKVSIARSRIQQQVAMLQAVEAVRAFAAANGGRLPGTLDETRLPIPHDPFTGRPLRYEVANGTAVIRGTPPSGREADATLNRVYEVQLRK
ncbi:hypothetical protein [Urbifossiella limnaea]|uniref:Uncharacterized protein n=1 Tax=Urbifossiella limnaea TaxID=2528023 RepID=A0A517XVB6_9BACT|nr:hypothetical protein [Urbifossiella limnaea]QDU21424.1 hypothetical protein ETAA1_33910 [Urbifossiella limnaea]